MNPATSDSELMARTAAGDRPAWRTLFERHGRFVLAVAYRYLGDETEARDILQDVFVALFTHARDYQPSSPFRSYLWRVVANRCLNERAHARHRLRAGAEELDAIADAERKAPDRLAEARQVESAVRRAVLALPDRQRMAVVLSRFEGLSYEETAQALSCSVSSVESLLFRARQTLARALAGI